MSDFDTSGNSLQLDCSVDSGICIEVTAEDLKKKLQEFKRILFILERDKEALRLLRERLSRIAERKTIKKKKDEQFCNVCFAPIDTEDFKACIACCSCAKYVCRGGDEKCSEWIPKDGEWRCRLCSTKRDSYGKTSTWVEEQYAVKKATPAYAYPMRARSEIYIPLCDPNDSAFLCNFESVSEAPSSINVNQKQQIREYIEEILAEMLGGTLDSTSVGQLSRSEHYIPASGNEHELQNISNVRLRRLIESIIAETVRLPPFVPSSSAASTTVADPNQHHDALTFNGNQCNGNAGQYFEPKKYQDLLATAVLNKIVDTHGNGRHSESSPDLTSSAFDKNHNALFPNKTDESISSSSSVEPRSESSLTDPLHNINKGDDIGSFENFYTDVTNENIEADRESVLSDFIASHMVPLPHISAEPASEEEEEEDEDFISVTSSGREATWEDNWLFKKKKSGKTASSIGMLVPAPKEDIRALIGDKTTDEVSDLSEVGSDTDDSSMEMASSNLEPLNGRLVNQHLIGGKNTKVVLDELVEQSSMISTSSLPENVPPYTETKNDFVVSNDGLSDSEPSKISVSNCNVAISNEAVNSNVTKTVASNTPAKTEAPLAKENQISEEESIVPPPNDFTDDEKMRNLMAKFNEEQNTKVDSGDENSSSLSPRSSISGALSDRISSESNQTDDSTPTVIETFASSQMGSGSDSDSGEDFTRDESTNRDSTTDTVTATTTTTNTITTNNVTNQSHINSPPPPPPPELKTESACSELQVVATRTTGGNEEHVDDDPLKHLVPGSIAEREYKKWYNAVDMPNNPYSAEALKRRISGGPERVIDLPNISPSIEEKPIMLGGDENKGEDDKSQERDYARYSRDYYINDAKHASGATKKYGTPAATPSPSNERPPLPPTSSASSSTSSIEPEDRSQEALQMSPVKAICHKLETQCRNELDTDIYTATPARIEEESTEEKDQQPGATIVPLTTEAVRKLSSETGSILTTESLTPSEDSDTIRIYDLKKQETRIIKDNQTTVPKTPVKKIRPTELEITPVLTVTAATPSSKSSTPTSFKFLQPKRKLINPSQVLSIDQDTTPISPTSTEKTVIEEDVVHSMPSVKALAQAFLLTSATCTTSDKWRKVSNVNRLQGPEAGISNSFAQARTKSPAALVKTITTPTPATPVAIQKPPEPADTTSQGSEDATIASDLSSLETDPPSKQDVTVSESLSIERPPSQGRRFSPVLVKSLKSNIAFFENLKNK